MVDDSFVRICFFIATICLIIVRYIGKRYYKYEEDNYVRKAIYVGENKYIPYFFKFISIVGYISIISAVFYLLLLGPFWIDKIVGS